MLSQLEKAMATIISVFHAYSGREGDKLRLTKKELRYLIDGEFSSCLSCPEEGKRLVDDLLQGLDMDKDGQVDFSEFMALVTALTIASNEFFVQQEQQKQ